MGNKLESGMKAIPNSNTSKFNSHTMLKPKSLVFLFFSLFFLFLIKETTILKSLINVQMSNPRTKIGLCTTTLNLTPNKVKQLKGNLTCKAKARILVHKKTNNSSSKSEVNVQNKKNKAIFFFKFSLKHNN